MQAKLKSGGYVTAYGGSAGAGIGGGYRGTGSSITISGGTVIATAGMNGAGIGGGNGGDDKGHGIDITISGGIVTATGGNGAAGIGGGYSADGRNITISGGTVTAISDNDVYAQDEEEAIEYPKEVAGIGAGIDGESTNIIVTGGNIKSTEFEGSSFGITPVNEEGVSVYKATMTVSEGDNKPVIKLYNLDYYNINDINTVDSNKLYFYLPENLNNTETELKYNGKRYSAKVTSDGQAQFIEVAPVIEEISDPEPVNISQKLNLTAPSVTPNGCTLTSQGWEISKTSDSGTFTHFDPNTALDESYDNAKLRYVVSYTIEEYSGTVYSNEVTVSLLKQANSEQTTDNIDNKTNANNNTANKSIGSGQIFTGDYNNILIYLTLMLVSEMVIIIVLTGTKGKKRNED